MAEAAESLPQDEAVQEPKQPKTPPIALSRVKQAEYDRNLWCVTVPIGTTPEQFLDQTYWQHVASLFKPRDRLEIMDDKMSFYCQAIVLAQDKLWCHLAPIAFVDLMKFHGQDIPIEEKDYSVDFAGSVHKHRVLYKGEVLKEGFETEGLARRWAANHTAARKR